MKTIGGYGICLLLLIPTTLAQNNTYNLNGIVRDEQTGEPLPHAAVQVKDSRLGAFTNSDGLFTILNIPRKANQILKVSYLGFQEMEIPISPENATSRLTVELTQTDFEVDEVIITTGASNIMKSTGLSKISLNPTQIQKLPSLGERDIFRTLTTDARSKWNE